MYRKIEDYESECNGLRRENKDLRNRLEKMQETIRRYQLERQELMKKLGLRPGPLSKE